MTKAIHGLFARTSFRLAFVLWCFGYVLVEIGALAQGRSAPGVMLLFNLPLLVLGVSLSLMLGWLLDRSGERLPLLRWPLVAFAVILAGALQTLADFLWLKTLALGIFPHWQEWALSTDPSRLFTIYLLYTWTMALSVALIWSARSNDMARLNQARAAAFEAAASRAEAAALRLQLNPHFLFNTLNGIASLVVARKTEEAEEMIGRLADFLRSSLAADPAALIPLEQELATVRAYLHVEEARFGERMRIAWNIEDDTLTVPIPNFLLQPLIENAIKHGVASSRHGVTIAIEAALEGDMLRLAVANRGSRPPARARGTGRGPLRLGIGLANTRQRLASLYGDAATLSADGSPEGYRCEIRLPAAGAAAERIEQAAAE